MNECIISKLNIFTPVRVSIKSKTKKTKTAVKKDKFIFKILT